MTRATASQQPITDSELGPHVPDGAISWLATMIGLVAVSTAGSLPLAAAVPLGLIGIAIGTIVIIGSRSRRGRGAGHGVAGVILTSVGLLATLGISLVPPIAQIPLPIPLPIPTTESSTPQASPTVIRLRPAAISASTTAPAISDGHQGTMAFDARNVLDDDPATAWAAEGDGIGSVLTISFQRPVHLAEIGVVVGCADSGKYAWIDTFGQFRRVSSARFTVDGGLSAEQTFADTAEVQHFAVAADTTALQITILSSTPGTRNLTAISEVELHGWEA